LGAAGVQLVLRELPLRLRRPLLSLTLRRPLVLPPRRRPLLLPLPLHRPPLTRQQMQPLLPLSTLA